MGYIQGLDGEFTQDIRLGKVLIRIASRTQFKNTFKFTSVSRPETPDAWNKINRDVNDIEILILVREDNSLNP